MYRQFNVMDKRLNEHLSIGKFDTQIKENAFLIIA